MTLPQSVRQSVIQRAGMCCEYCRLLYTGRGLPFHVDHIIPVKHGGGDDMANLCLACYKCNAHKGYDLSGFDPLSGQLTRLFDPRQQVWAAHFRIQPDMQIEGLTPEGRTTVGVLKVNDDDRTETRQLLATVGLYPCRQGESEPLLGGEIAH